jgi:hypothetical protein
MSGSIAPASSKLPLSTAAEKRSKEVKPPVVVFPFAKEPLTLFCFSSISLRAFNQGYKDSVI